MKGFFKFTTAALALVALASCSNEDLLGNSPAVEGQSANGLQVEVEPMIDGLTTRAAFVPDGTANQLYWQKGDEIWVFDEAMLKYDTYEFSPKRAIFENNGADNVKTPAFAFTNDPWNALTRKSWFSDLDQVGVVYNVSATPLSGVDNSIASTKGNPVKAYEFSIPMFGEAAQTENGVSVSMKYLTAVLRVEMGQLPADWTGIEISAYDDQAMENPAPITGHFKAVVADGDEVNADAQLSRLSAADESRFGITAVNGNTMTLNFADWDPEDLANMREKGGYVYIPLIAQYYGALKFEYIKGSKKTFFKKTKPFTAKRATVYRMNIEELEIAGSDAPSVNALLVKEKDTEGDVVISTTHVTELSDGKNVIIIPAGMKASSLTFDLKGIDGGTAKEPFEIESEDGKYTGDVVLDLSDGDVKKVKNVFLNLPNSNVTVKGDFTAAVDFGSKSSKRFDCLIVKSLTFAAVTQEDLDKGHNPTTCGSVYPDYASFSTGDGITVDEDATVGDIDMKKTGETGTEYITKSSIVINGTAGDVIADAEDPTYVAPAHKYSDVPVTFGDKGKANDVTTASNITLSGKAVTNDLTSIEGEVSVSGEATTNDIDAAGDITVSEGASTGALTSGANITVSDKAAVSGTITAEDGVASISTETAIKKTVKAKEVELSGKANVKTVKAAEKFTMAGTSTAATVTAAKVVDIALEEEGEAISTSITVADKTAITLTQGYIKEIKVKSGEAELTFGEGEGFTAIATIPTTGLKIKNASTWNGEKIADKFSAAYNTTTFGTANFIFTAVQLASNPYTASYIALGNDIDLANEAWTPIAKLQTSFIGNEKTIKNLSVTGADDKGTGLFATITAAAQIGGKLTIDGATIDGSGKSYVGVIAGKAEADLTVKDLTIKNATVKGKYYVGGLFGSSKALDITAADVAGVTLSNPNAATEPTLSTATDDKAGSFGRYAGLVDGNFKADKDAAGTLDMAALGMWAQLKKDSGKGYYFYPGTVNCGQIGATLTSYQVGTTTYDPAVIWTVASYASATNYAKKDDAKTAKALGCYVEASEWKK